MFSKQVDVVKIIIGLIIILTISNTQTMSVLERTTEIGTSLAIGLRSSEIMRLFLLEGALIGIVEQIKFKEAQVALLLTDNETTEQVAAATGSARTTDLGLGGLAFGGMGGAGGMGWSNTNEGKVIAAAFLDAHNKLVVQARELMAKDLPPPIATKKIPSQGR